MVRFWRVCVRGLLERVRGGVNGYVLCDAFWHGTDWFGIHSVKRMRQNNKTRLYSCGFDMHTMHTTSATYYQRCCCYYDSMHHILLNSNRRWWFKKSFSYQNINNMSPIFHIANNTKTFSHTPSLPPPTHPFIYTHLIVNKMSVCVCVWVLREFHFFRVPLLFCFVVFY